MKSIDCYRGIHSGETLLILGTGPSSKQHDLSRIDCPVIGLNQAWQLRHCDYYCAGDREQFAKYRKAHDGDASSWSPLFSIVKRGAEYPYLQVPKHAVKLEAHHVNGRKRFSFELARDGVYLNNTVASYGFQLATWMLGYEGTILLLGVDCTGNSIDGYEIPERKHQNQRETLAYIRGILDGARPYICVYTLSQVMNSFAFERKHFDDFFSA